MIWVLCLCTATIVLNIVVYAFAMRRVARLRAEVEQIDLRTCRPLPRVAIAIASLPSVPGLDDALVFLERAEVEALRDLGAYPDGLPDGDDEPRTLRAWAQLAGVRLDVLRYYHLTECSLAEALRRSAEGCHLLPTATGGAK